MLWSGAVFALLGGLAVPAIGSPEERRIVTNRAKVTTILTELEQARSRRDADASSLRDAERQVQTVMEAVGAAEQAVQRQQQAVLQARDDLVALQARADQQRSVIAARAEVLYKRGAAALISSLLEAANPQEALRRSAYVDVISRNDRRAMETVTVTQTAVDAQRRKLQAEEGTLARVLDEQRKLLVEVERVRNDRAIAFAASNQEVAQLEGHLESESREVAAIARRGSASASRGGGAALSPVAARGGWAWPARGPVTSGFGARWGRMHEGIDIGAPTGAPIVAARTGTVTYAGTMGNYGRFVLIDHGGGLSTAYAHMSTIAVRVGQQVGTGQRIGSVGCSGSCTGPHLHFEVRIGGSARNPSSYL